ncbi:MAG: energy transducer TonB [Alistipes sp.]|nr:energy transducer TonB [Alistipes sp.]
MMGKTKPATGIFLRGLCTLPLLGALMLLFSFTTKDPVYIFTAGNDDQKEAYFIDNAVSIGYGLPTETDVKGKIYYFIDGNEVAQQIVESLDPSTIQSIDMGSDPVGMLQNGTDPAAAGLVLVKLKPSVESSPALVNSAVKPSYYIDGREATAREASAIDSDKIAHVSILSGSKAEERYGKSDPVILIALKSEPDQEDSSAFPKFLGGDMSNFSAWVQRQIALDPRSEGLTGKVTVSFGVDRSGKVTDITVRETPSQMMGRIVTDILERSPRWTPARKESGTETPSSLGMSFIFGTEMPFAAVDKMPLFNGSDVSAFRVWATKRIADDPAAEGLAGSVEASFVINTEGTVTDVEIINSPSFKMGEIVTKVFASSDRWTPGTLNGERVPVKLKTVIHFPARKNLESGNLPQDEEPFIVVENMPVFEGGNLASFRDWVQGKVALDSRSQGMSGRVTVTFVIDKTGKIVNVERLDSTSDEMFRIVKDAIESAPAWTPGTQRGIAVPVRLNLPVVFDYETISPGSPKQEPFIMVEQMPTFEGGSLSVFRDWVQEKVALISRSHEISGKVVVSFVIDEDGNLGDIVRLRAPSDESYDIVREILESSPRWSPGVQRGTKVPVRFNLPVDFGREN